jgi:hypothetical protein
LGAPPDSGDKKELERETSIEKPQWEVEGGLVGVEGHLDIGGEDGDEERDEADGGGAAEGEEEEAYGAGDFGEAAEEDEEGWVWEVGGDDLLEGSGVEEVE